MRLLSLAYRSLLSRRLAAVLTAVTIALGVFLLLAVERVRVHSRDSFASTVSGTDLIVGPRTSPTALLLYSVFHIGEPSANVSWNAYKAVSSLPEVAWTVPLSLGDSHRGFRVVGTETSFFAHYRYGARHALRFEAGEAFSGLHQAVLGAEVARALGYGPGDEIVLAHGTASVALQEHRDQPFRVVGVLAATGTPVDATLMVSLQSIEAIHADWQSGVHIPGSGEPVDSAHEPQAITAFLVGLKSRASTFAVQRHVNAYDQEPLIAILPGIALQQLWRITGSLEQALRAISAIVVMVGFAGMVTAMITTLSARRREMAILRALGARPRQIAGMWMLEAGILSVAGMLMGCLGLLVGAHVAQAWLLREHAYALELASPTVAEGFLLGGVLLAGLLAACIPAALAYRRTLADGLAVES
jgi:putative ABC transport system permease protein